MHARRYDSSSGRFGVADVVLGALSDPLSLNRYLYCESDPVNYADPTGHASRSLRLSRGKAVTVNLRGVNTKKKLTSWDSRAVSGQANLDPVWRDFNMLSGALEMHTTAYGARKAAYGNTVRLNNEKADLIERKYGWDARQAFSAQVARNFKVHVERYYCGSNPHLNEVASTLHSFAQDYWYLPVVPTLADWCAYVSEGDVQNTVLYSFYSLLDVVPGGSSVFRIGEKFAVKAGSKLTVGSGFAEAAATSITSTAKSSASTTTKAVTILNRGSTGRTKAAGLLEELAMEATKADPLATAKELKKDFSMFDPRWPKESGWVKMQNLVPTSQGNINIHFLYNKNTNEFDDFKFISNEIKGCYNPYRGGIDK